MKRKKSAAELRYQKALRTIVKWKFSLRGSSWNHKAILKTVIEDIAAPALRSKTQKET